MITDIPKLEDADEHQKSFDQQPITTKELELLNEQVEKTIGKESTRLHQAIREKSKEPTKMEACRSEPDACP